MKIFKKIYIEITNVCNLACYFCPATKRSPEFMSIETFEKILLQIKGHTEYIYLHVKGEPLLHPQLPKFLDLSYEHGFKVNITTNGTLIKKVKDMLISKPAVRQINFSLHSFDGNENVGSMSEYLQDIFSFTFEALERSNIFIALRLWNLDEDNIFSSEAKKNLNILESVEEAFALPYKIEDKIVKNRGIKIGERVYLNHDFEFKWPDLKEESLGNSGYCYGLKTLAAILVDGTVVPCCLDGEGIIKLGNIHASSFSEIIESERANNIYKGFSMHEVTEELCRRCGFRKRFGI